MSGQSALIGQGKRGERAGTEGRARTYALVKNSRLEGSGQSSHRASGGGRKGRGPSSTKGLLTEDLGREVRASPKG